MVRETFPPFSKLLAIHRKFDDEITIIRQDTTGADLDADVASSPTVYCQRVIPAEADQA